MPEGAGGLSGAFATGPQADSHGHRFLPPLSEPGVRDTSSTGLSSGIMRLAHGFPVATSGAGLAKGSPRAQRLRLLTATADVGWVIGSS